MARNSASLFVLSCVLLWGFAVCSGCKSPTHIEVDQTSPKTLLESICRASEAHDFSAQLQCLEPASSRWFKPIFEAWEKYWKTASALGRLIEERIGKEEAARFFELAGLNTPDFASDFALEGGRVNWDRVKIVMTSDSEAAIHLGEGPTGDRLIRVDGKWYYRVFMAASGAFDDWQPKLAEGIADKSEYMEQVRKKIERGEINKDNFKNWWKEKADELLTELGRIARKIRQKDPPEVPEDTPLTDEEARVWQEALRLIVENEAFRKEFVELSKRYEKKHGKLGSVHDLLREKEFQDLLKKYNDRLKE